MKPVRGDRSRRAAREEAAGVRYDSSRSCERRDLRRDRRRQGSSWAYLSGGSVQKVRMRARRQKARVRTSLVDVLFLVLDAVSLIILIQHLIHHLRLKGQSEDQHSSEGRSSDEV